MIRHFLKHFKIMLSLYAMTTGKKSENKKYTWIGSKQNDPRKILHTCTFIPADSATGQIQSNRQVYKGKLVFIFLKGY